MTASGHPHFDQLVAKAKTLQARLVFLPTVAVGGTAVAIYAKHRVSLDVDFVSPLLAERFDDVENALLGMEDFSIARIRRPVLILGSLDGDEIGLRQLRRGIGCGATGLVVGHVAGGGGRLRVAYAQRS
jgi:hypothetical protein